MRAVMMMLAAAAHADYYATPCRAYATAMRHYAILMPTRGAAAYAAINITYARALRAFCRRPRGRPRYACLNDDNLRRARCSSLRVYEPYARCGAAREERAAS